MIRNLAVLVISLIITNTAIAADESGITQQRQEIRQMADQAITDLLKQKPELRQNIDSAVGYAAFSNVGVQVVFFGGGGGRGIVKDKASGKEYFMRMAQVTAGFGLGVKDLRVVFIFRDKESMNSFVHSGWEFGAEAEAAAKSDDKGGSVSRARLADRGIEVYTLTKAGVSATATVGGTKYWKDGGLN